MSRTKLRSTCGACGHDEPRWLGRCPACGSWGSMSEETAVAPAATRTGGGGGGGVSPALPIADVPVDGDRRLPSGVGELDRVLGGGLVPGSVTLLGGEPGAGKSTLLLQAAHALAEAGVDVLYVSAEESPAQVRGRAERLGTLAERLLLASETDVEAITGLVERHAPQVLVVDSIQTVQRQDAPGTPGGMSQVRDCALALTRLAKQRQVATILVGHVTKDGQLAGPRQLEHLVDTVCEMEGDRHLSLRLLRAVKNRFGAVGEVGCFELGDAGLTGVRDAGRLFLGGAAEGTCGVTVTLALEGRRPLACEVQALVDESALANPRRVVSGLDLGRLHVLLAVLHRCAKVDLHTRDVYASSVGGVRLSEPAVDLALCLAVASSRLDRPVRGGMVALGEVGLAGEIRLVGAAERRLSEAARMGFAGAMVPAAYDGKAFGLHLQHVRNLPQALDAALAG